MMDKLIMRDIIKMLSILFNEILLYYYPSINPRKKREVVNILRLFLYTKHYSMCVCVYQCISIYTHNQV